MAELNAGCDGLSFRTMDATSLTYDGGTFDVVLDKGMMDCVLKTETGPDTVPRMLREMRRVMKPGGLLWLCSIYQPDDWLGYLEREEWAWELKTVALDQAPIEAPEETKTFIFIAKANSN